jgi:hypothetical protein
VQKSVVRGSNSLWCRSKFPLTNPSGPTIILLSAQPLTEMSTRNISCVRLTKFPPSCGHCLRIWDPQLLGTLRACTGSPLQVSYQRRNTVHSGENVFLSVLYETVLSTTSMGKIFKICNSSLNKDEMDSHHLL